MLCPACQAQNASQNRFCEQCGAALEVGCPACGATTNPGARFCGACGHNLGETTERSARAPKPAAARDRNLAAYTPNHLAQKILTSRSAIEGERRQVTVLFADIAGFTALSERLDPEDVHAIVDGCFALITAEIHRLEGTINQYTGDGVMALFGAPIAHEDAPRRAVHAALGIQRAIREYARSLEADRGLRLEMRVGINTGIVVVGKIGDDLRMDYTAVGDTTNLAARLQQTARPGAVVISEATAKLVSGFFQTTDLGEIAAKGRAAVHAYEVVRARGRRARLDVAVERGLTPLVSRARELATLAEIFERAKAGHGQVAWIAGDAGIGKSRLVLEFRRQLAAGGATATWLEGRCVSFGQSIPFLPIIDQLRENFGIEEVDGEPEIIAKVETGMRAMGGLERHIPFIRYLLSVDPGDPAVTAMDAAARRKQALDAVSALVFRGAQLRPIVFVYEDLHWIDTSTEEYLGQLIDSIAAVPVMLILTHRFGYQSPFGSRSFFTTLSLHALSQEEALTMAGRVLDSPSFPPELATALMEKAEGVPLFIEEVTKTLLDVGVLRRDTGGYQIVKSMAEVNVPETIQGIILARLDRLGEDGKRTVQLASVIGRQFLVRLLEKISGLTGRLEGLLRELKALEIIYDQGLLPEPAYVFKHAVIQDVAYQSLLRQKRKELHEAVGLAIEELYADRLADHFAELAHHFMAGESWEKALDYGIRAADQAAHAFANVEAKHHYERALGAVKNVSPLPDGMTLASIHEKLGAVLNVLGESDAAVVQYQSALELVRAAGDRRREFDVLMGFSLTYNLAHRGEPALEHARNALEIARALGDPGLEAVALTERVQLLTAGYGRVVESTAEAEEALRLSSRIDDERLLARTRVFLGQMFVWRGDFDRGIENLGESERLAERSHSGFIVGMSTFMAGHAHLAKGDYEEALRTYERLRAYASSSGDKFFVARTPNVFGAVHLELYDLDEAIRLCAEGDEASRRAVPWPEPRGHSLLKMGLAHLERDQHGPADEYFRRAWQLLDEDVWYRWRWHIPLLRARGELERREGRHDEAWKYAQQSVDMAVETDARKHLSRALALQGEILAESGRPEEAIAKLREAATIARGIGAKRDMWLTEAALGRRLAELGRLDDAEAALESAARTIESIAEKLVTPRLRTSFLSAEPVRAVYRALARPAPDPASSFAAGALH
jgi:class 3 adenylate cyclase/tetratricopeptide (TPR) repeat protein